jgi:hypothetical protein
MPSTVTQPPAAHSIQSSPSVPTSAPASASVPQSSPPAAASQSISATPPQASASIPTRQSPQVAPQASVGPVPMYSPVDAQDQYGSWWQAQFTHSGDTVKLHFIGFPESNDEVIPASLASTRLRQHVPGTPPPHPSTSIPLSLLAAAISICLFQAPASVFSGPSEPSSSPPPLPLPLPLPLLLPTNPLSLLLQSRSTLHPSPLLPLLRQSRKDAGNSDGRNARAILCAALFCCAVRPLIGPLAVATSCRRLGTFIYPQSFRHFSLFCSACGICFICSAVLQRT